MKPGAAGRRQPDWPGSAFLARLPSSAPAIAASAICVLLLVLAPLPWLAPLCVVALALLFLHPLLGLYLVILSVPVQQMVLLPGGLSVTQAATLLMLVAWARHAALGRLQRVGGPALALWALLLWSLLLATCFTPYSQTEAIKATMRWAVAGAAWLGAVTCVARRRELLGLLACLLAAPAAEALLGVAQFFTGAGPAGFRIAADLPFVRAYGTIGQPNSFAGYLNMAWPLALALAAGATGALLARAPGRERRWGLALAGGLWLLLALLLGGLLLSFSLGGWVGALAGALGVALVFGGWWRRGALAGGVGLGAFLGLGGAQLLPAAVAGRITRLTGGLALFDPATVTVTPENFALVERMAQMTAGWRMALDHPLTGVGPGNYTLAYAHYAVAPWYASRGHAHNFYLNALAETGVVGLIAYLLLIGGFAWLAIVSARRTDRAERCIGVGCCGIIAAVAGHNLFENLHVLNLGIQLAGVWALPILLQRGVFGTERLVDPAEGGRAARAGASTHHF